jgi:hypothetical protein
MSTCNQLPGAKLPSHLVTGSPSIAIAGVMPGCGVAEDVARHSLRGGSCSSAPDARDAASTLKSPASRLENLATLWLCTCCAFSAVAALPGMAILANNIHRNIPAGSSAWSVSDAVVLLVLLLILAAILLRAKSRTGAGDSSEKSVGKSA